MTVIKTNATTTVCAASHIQMSSFAVIMEPYYEEVQEDFHLLTLCLRIHPFFMLFEYHQQIQLQRGKTLQDPFRAKFSDVMISWPFTSLSVVLFFCVLTLAFECVNHFTFTATRAYRSIYTGNHSINGSFSVNTYCICGCNVFAWVGVLFSCISTCLRISLFNDSLSFTL